MPYTHYWENPNGFNTSEWDKITNEVRKLLEENKTIPLIGASPLNPNSKPVINNKQIIFNGAGENGANAFVFSKLGSDFEFCKTEKKPYDALVVAVLKIAKKHNPAIVLSSDGGKDIFK